MSPEPIPYPLLPTTYALYSLPHRPYYLAVTRAAADQDERVNLQ